MQAPPKPIDEAKRLRALHELQILDTVEDERFDRVTRIAARLFDVPIALVVLLDEERQWFKSRQGLTACETSRDVSFCGHAILELQTLVVNDALQDPRFHDNPLVVGEPNIRFYAGHPLRSADGSRVGTLCIIDRKPREFSTADAQMLADLAAMVEKELTLLCQATQDPLTLLHNRRGLRDAARHVIALCGRNRGRATYAAFDLDNFKIINDQQGHRAGDDVLRGFASMLSRHFRSSDVVARLGGDEFCVLAPQITEAAMKISLDRLSYTFRDSALHRAYPDLSWSAGIIDFHCTADTDLASIMQLADKRMYDEKEHRRSAFAQSG
jgi:diguanylate cyclase (GGDEF)-like protein